MALIPYQVFFEYRTLIKPRPLTASYLECRDNGSLRAAPRSFSFHHRRGFHAFQTFRGPASQVQAGGRNN